MLDRNELAGLSTTADELLNTLRAIEASLARIGEKRDSLPSPDELHDLEQSLSSIHHALATIPGLYEALPDRDELSELERQTGAIAANLPEAAE